MAYKFLHRLGTRRDALMVGNMYVKSISPPDLNKNTSWFQYPGVWTTYILLILVSWLLMLSVFGCSAGTAWTSVNLLHAAITYRFFHWKKGTPFAEDQGQYSMLTWWEQVDDGRQLTRNRKFLTMVPVILFLIASHTTYYQMPWLIPNTIAVSLMVVAKFPNMHKLGLSDGYCQHPAPSSPMNAHIPRQIKMKWPPVWPFSHLLLCSHCTAAPLAAARRLASLLPLQLGHWTSNSPSESQPRSMTETRSGATFREWDDPSVGRVKLDYVKLVCLRLTTPCQEENTMVHADPLHSTRGFLWTDHEQLQD